MHHRARERFRRFIASSNEEGTKLPLLHTTAAYDFTEIAGADSIAPMHCDIFDEELTYLFYGRPAYRTQAAVHRNLKYNWPFCFVLDPEHVASVKAIYPFDTGAFALGLYQGFFHKNTERDDFRLPGDLKYARKVAGRFYEDAKDYLTGGTQKYEDLPLSEFEAQGIQALANYPQRVALNANTPQRDERSTSIEVQSNCQIEIDEACMALIIPEPWAVEPIFQEAIGRWNIADKVHKYEIDSVNEQNNWVGSLYPVVRQIYKDLDLIE